VNDLQIAVATTLGALLVLVAAWLLVMRRDREDSQNRAKFLGIEFELSTPALVVLLIGAGLLVGPAFAPHRPGGWPALSRGSTPPDGAVSPGSDTILRQQTVVNSEAEPNDRPATANMVAYGDTVTGKLTPDDVVDQFIFKVPNEQAAESRLIVRFLTSGMYLSAVSVWNAREELLLKSDAIIANQTLSKVISKSTSYLVEVRVSTFTQMTNEVDYEIVLSRN
jgi:hypothetical protein